MRVAVVLDETALASYARLRDTSVGELVKMVEEENDRTLVGIPAACFLTAYAELKDGDDRRRLVRLATDTEGVAAILPLLGGDTVEVARFGIHGVIEAVRHGALLATYDGETARRWMPPTDVLDLGREEDG